MALTWRARMQPGEQVLVLGAGGVVGQVAAQAAVRTQWCRCTTRTTNSP